MPTIEQSAFEETYRAEYRRVYGYLARRLTPDVVDDAVAEVFVIAWRKRADLPPNPTGWLLRAAANVAARHYRAKGRFDALIAAQRDEAAAARAPAAESEALERLATLEALATLNDRDREALLLVAWEGLTTEQAAEAAGCAPGTFRVRVMRARKKFRAALRLADGYGAEDTGSSAGPPRPSSPTGPGGTEGRAGLAGAPDAGSPAGPSGEAGPSGSGEPSRSREPKGSDSTGDSAAHTDDDAGASGARGTGAGE